MAKASRDIYLAYRERDNLLATLGFATYAAYLESDLWKSIRIRVVASQPKCVACHCETQCVHHAAYTLANLSGKTLDRLLGICFACHDHIEFDDAGEKLSLEAANARLFALGRKHLRPAAPSKNKRSKQRRKARNARRLANLYRKHGTELNTATRPAHWRAASG